MLRVFVCAPVEQIFQQGCNCKETLALGLLTGEEKQMFFRLNAEKFYRFHDLPEMPYVHHMAE